MARENPAQTTRLWLEFIAIFVGAPLLMTVTFGSYPLLPVLVGFGVLAAILLHLTPGWRWSMIVKGPVFGEWRLILLYAALTGGVTTALVFALVPSRFLVLPRYQTDLWLMILCFYPIVSAFPQELIFRSLFFERYGRLFPNKWVAIAINGAAFAFGHLFFEHWLTIVMTGLGGAFMAWGYLRHRSVGLAWVFHSLAGQIIFTVGLGVYFYHGSVGATP